MTVSIKPPDLYTSYRKVLILNSYLKLIISLCFCAIAGFSQAKTLPSKAKVDQASEFFMSQLLVGDIETAYTLMSAYQGVDMNAFIERSKKVEQDLANLQKSIGKPLSYALLKQQSVAEHFYKVSYLLKYESAALVWELNYYQPSTGWKLVDITFNGDINALFE